MKPASLKTPACTRCGYSLSGLRLDECWVECPECSFLQGMIAWSPDALEPRTMFGRYGSFFAVVGFLAMIFLGIPVVLLILAILLTL